MPGATIPGIGAIKPKMLSAANYSIEKKEREYHQQILDFVFIFFIFQILNMYIEQ